MWGPDDCEVGPKRQESETGKPLLLSFQFRDLILLGILKDAYGNDV